MFPLNINDGTKVSSPLTPSLSVSTLHPSWFYFPGRQSQVLRIGDVI